MCKVWIERYLAMYRTYLGLWRPSLRTQPVDLYGAQIVSRQAEAFSCRDTLPNEESCNYHDGHWLNFLYERQTIH